MNRNRGISTVPPFRSAVLLNFFHHSIKHLKFLNHCVDSLRNIPPDTIVVFTLPDEHPLLIEMLNVTLTRSGFDKVTFEFQDEPLSKPGRFGVLLLVTPSRNQVEHGSQIQGLVRFLQWADKSPHPVILIPLVFLWNRDPSQPIYNPNLLNLLRFRRQMLLTFGNLIPLKERDSSNIQVAANRLARRIAVARRREIRIITGRKPEARSVMIERLLRNPDLKTSFRDLAANGRRTIHDLERDARKMFDEIASSYRDWAPRLWDSVLTRFFSKLYSSIEFDIDGLRRFRNMLGEKNKVLLAPCHRSHMDYISLSLGCYLEGITPPLVAAGINLAFFPMGWIFRHTGAFFIRRTFKGQDLYPRVFRTYLIDLVRQFHPLEVFIEGGRSRSGRFRPPKLGFVGILIDAIRKGEAQDVQILPISINYDRLIEERSYIDELEGKPKKKETLMQMVRNRHLLRQDYGKIFVSFGTPVSLRNRIDSYPDSADFKEMLGLDLLFQMARRMSVTPVAIVASTLLIMTSRCMTARVSTQLLLDQSLRILSAIEPTKPIPAKDLRQDRDPIVSFKAALEFLERTGYCIRESSGDLSIRIPPDRRVALDYLRNSLIGMFLPVSLVAVSRILDRELKVSGSLNYIAQVLCPGFFPFPAEEVVAFCRKIEPEIPLTIDDELLAADLIRLELTAVFHLRAYLENRLEIGVDTFDMTEWLSSISEENNPQHLLAAEIRTTDFVECLVRSLLKQKRICRLNESRYRIKSWGIDLPVESDRSVLAVLRSIHASC